MSANGKVKVATLWLSGCSGCHMSFLDLDERLLELSKLVDIKASPIVDIKFDQIPEVDVGIVEGCVNNNEQEEHLRHLRDKCKILIALGDCAITGNVPTLPMFSLVPALLGKNVCLAKLAQPQADGLQRLLAVLAQSAEPVIQSPTAGLYTFSKNSAPFKDLSDGEIAQKLTEPRVIEDFVRTTPYLFLIAIITGALRDRLRGLRANASCRSHAELDASTDLDAGDPAALARDYGRLRKVLPRLTVVGGCCGTDHRHVACIGDALLAGQ